MPFKRSLKFSILLFTLNHQKFRTDHLCPIVIGAIKDLFQLKVINKYLCFIFVGRISFLEPEQILNWISVTTLFGNTPRVISFRFNCEKNWKQSKHLFWQFSRRCFDRLIISIKSTFQSILILPIFLYFVVAVPTWSTNNQWSFLSSLKINTNIN